MIRRRLPAVLALALVLAACGGGAKPDPVVTTPDPEPGPPVTAAPDPLDHFDPVAPEVDKARTAVALPAVPDFALPPVKGGMHSVKELRVAGKQYLETDIVVTGYITWIYDCVTAVGLPGEKLATVKKRIEQDPTLCERPKFHLGTTADAAETSTLWVVDVPRAPNKLEKQRLPKAELAAWPAVPKLAVGDRVAVTGTFTRRSPHGEMNSDGLIVYKSLQPLKRGE